MGLLKFTKYEASIHRAIVVSFDLSGFSDFCKQPDVTSVAAPRLIKGVFDLLNSRFGESDQPASQHSIRSLRPRRNRLATRSSLRLKSKAHTTYDKLPPPDFNKFTGDGALMLWLRAAKDDFSQGFCDLLVKSMRDFQSQLSGQLPVWEKTWHLHGLPKKVRVGIATGTVYGLRPPHNSLTPPQPIDYVGYCINLAVRLQDHCKELGFLVHGDLHPGLQGMQQYEAFKLKGSASEPVALFIEDRDRVKSDHLAQFITKFSELKTN